MADSCDIEGDGSRRLRRQPWQIAPAAKLFQQRESSESPRNNTHDTPPFDLTFLYRSRWQPK
jgi:hypothetical protein